MKYFFYFMMSTVCIILCSKYSSAQIFYRATVLSGTQLLGGTTVTVTPINSPSNSTGYCSDSGPYCIGGPGSPNVSGYKFAFNPSASKVKMQVEFIDSAETVSVYINGSFYNLSTSTITALPCSSSANITVPTVVLGSLACPISNTVDGYGIVDISPGYPIDSIRIMKGGIQVGGVVHNLYFARDTFITINQPFIDTALCAGDSLYINYKVSNKFKLPNTFTAQLSNSSGSFSSPINIGFKVFDTSGTIACVIPLSTTFGTGYRIRIISTNPVKTSQDVGKNIVVGNTYPTAVTATNNGPICAGSTLALSASSPTSGVTYSWRGPNSFSSILQNPTIGATTTAASGNYIVSAILNGCAVKDTTTAVVNIIPTVPTASNNTPICIGSNIVLNASSITPGVSYNWIGPAGFTSSLQNPTIVAATSANVGTYSVTASLNGCSSAAASTTASGLVAGPSVLMYPSPNDSICVGKNVTFTAMPVNSGISPSYQWLLNGNSIIGASNSTYTSSSVMDGDVFSVLLTPGPGSACTTPVNSNSIPIHVLQYQTPFVTISSSDSISWPGVLINFHGTAGNAGSYPKYQWKLNGQNVQGATDSIWGATTLLNKDSVCIEVTSSYPCPSPAKVKACTAVKISTGIKDVAGDGISVYPDPFRDELIVSRTHPNPRIPSTTNSLQSSQEGTTTVQLVNVLGRVVYSAGVTGDKTVINTSQLPAGNYILLLTDKDGNRSTWKVVKE